MRRVYLSDLHLEDATAPASQRFRECILAEAAYADEICVLGDLVEMWVGDDEDSEVADLLRTTFASASQTTQISLMHGNRDFLFGETFATACGATLLPDPWLTSDGLLLSHGDRYCIDDAEYQAARAMFRDPEWQRDILSKTLEERKQLGRMLREQSRISNANKASNIMDTNTAAIAADLEKHGAHTMIHGHTHRPQTPAGGGKKYVLGAWEACGWVLRQDADRLRLECFSLARPYAPTGTPL